MRIKGLFSEVNTTKLLSISIDVNLIYGNIITFKMINYRGPYIIVYFKFRYTPHRIIDVPDYEL